mmetsp:Transcript_65894/g.169567  ORF Transcript_65894/g.169567 Transcript_65894/m.169567 type:complete len:260 (-) Transcript_65894:390-1169(-)
MRCHELHDVERGGLATAAAARVHGQRAVVHHEEERHAGAAVAEADPQPAARAIPLVCAVLGDVIAAFLDHIPGGVAVGQRHRVVPHDSGELALQTGVAQHAADVLALLEAHDVVRLALVRSCDKLTGAPPGAAAAAEEVPPEEVVGQHLDVHIAVARAVAEPPPVCRRLRLAPLAHGMPLAHRLPADDGPHLPRLVPRARARLVVIVCLVPAVVGVPDHDRPARRLALGEAARVEELLELPEGRRAAQAGVPLRVLVDA